MKACSQRRVGHAASARAKLILLTHGGPANTSRPVGLVPFEGSDTMTAVTRPLAEFAAGLSYDSLPPEVADRVKVLVLDNVGIALRARHEARSTPALVAAAMLQLPVSILGAKGHLKLGDKAPAFPFVIDKNGILHHVSPRKLQPQTFSKTRAITRSARRLRVAR